MSAAKLFELRIGRRLAHMCPCAVRGKNTLAEAIHLETTDLGTLYTMAKGARTGAISIWPPKPLALFSPAST